MKKSFIEICILAFLLNINTAFGWGEIGHRAVGEIASRHLTSVARTKIAKLLGEESLARVATWADEIRLEKEYAHQAPWHYVEIPLGKTYDSTTASPKGDVLQALEKARAVLLDKKSSIEQKKESLKLFVHFMGDLHQPFHVGNGADAGGNLCNVQWMGSDTDLHSVWDHSMFDTMKLSYTELAAFLDGSKNVLPEAKSSFLEIAQESAAVREELYPLSLSSEKKIELPEERTFCRKSFDAPKAKKELYPNIGLDYRHQHWPLVEKRIRQAGHRLAYQLNKILQNP